MLLPGDASYPQVRTFRFARLVNPSLPRKFQTLEIHGLDHSWSVMLQRVAGFLLAKILDLTKLSPTAASKWHSNPSCNAKYV